jgi:hypothetical protein
MGFSSDTLRVQKALGAARPATAAADGVQLCRIVVLATLAKMRDALARGMGGELPKMATPYPLCFRCRQLRDIT